MRFAQKGKLQLRSIEQTTKGAFALLASLCSSMSPET
jgi:hypothetical protein